MGEAAARVSEPAREAHPQIPWSQIVGMRNVLVHVYFDIDHDQLWETVVRDLPPLTAALELILRAL